jgi:phytoene dehydrogenase-like protein
MYDIAIVGGGIAGLTAASYLARAGRSVALFERSATLGGRAATTNHDGFLFNRGGHALYTGGAASDVLRELGVTYRAGVPKRAFGLVEGRLSPLPTGPVALLTTRLLDPAAKLELVRVLSGLPRLDARALGGTTVADWIAGTAKRPRARRLLTAFAQAYVYSAALDLVSADVFVDKLQRSLKHPIHYVEGGWQTLVEGLARTAAAAGARIETGAAVEAAALEGDQAVGVRVGGQLVEAGAVVLATEPAAASRLVEAGEHPALRRIVDDLVPARIACLDVALRRLPDPSHPVVVDLGQPRLAAAQSVYARVAPPGAALVHAVKWLDPRGPEDPAADERDLEGLLDAVQPGWRDLVVKRFFLPRIAAVGALPLAARGGFAGRPDVAVRGLAGLYLAGDWVGAEGFLVDASAASARQAARAILARPRAERGTVNGRRLLLAR